MIYYNEFDEPTAWWLKGLSDNGVIPKGFVDTRSIVEVDPDELKQYTSAISLQELVVGLTLLC